MLYLFLHLVGKEDGRLHSAFAQTGRTHFRYVHFHRGAHTLACNLHESEFGEGQYIVASAVATHQFAHLVVQLILMLLGIHIDKIDDDDTSYIAEPQLVYNLFGCQHIVLERILLLIFV